MSYAEEGLHLGDAGQTRTRWSGFIAFAGFLLALVGLLQVIVGLAAIVDDGYYRVTHNGLAVHFTYTQWGWIHIALGVLLVAVGAALARRKSWARWPALAMAALSLFASFLFMAASPPFGIVLVTLDILIIYAIAVHGDELTSEGD